jgi:Cft2 family RNA processing exonuclease
VHFVSLGASDTIGASCHYVRAAGSGIFLAAGADPEQEGEASVPHLEVVSTHHEWSADHVILTHAHHDHVGSLPVLIRAFPRINVHMTAATRELVDVLLPASAKLQRKRLREGGTISPPLFSEEELGAVSYLYEARREGETFPVGRRDAPDAVQARFFSAGHILGAAGVELRVRDDGEERSLFYTSDTNMRAQSIIPGGEYPRAPVDILVVESTLCGDPTAELGHRPDEERRMGEDMHDVLGLGGSVLLPVFSLGRAQEVLCLVDRFKREGLVPADVPVYTVGTMRAISEVYDRTRLTTPRINADFEVQGVQQDRLPRSARRVREIAGGPSIFVLSSGMMFEHTASNRVAQLLVGDSRNAVFLVGFAREDSPAARLLVAAHAGDEEVVLDSAVGPQPLACRVDRYRLTGHSHRRDLLELVARLAPRRVLVVHGEQDSREWLADNISYFNPGSDVLLPETGQVLRL